MHLSILLRVALDPLDDGRVAGRAEIVDTGETTIFSDADQLLAFVHSVAHARRISAAAVAHDATRRGPAAM